MANHANDDDFSMAMKLSAGSVLPMVLRAAIELDLFEIMANHKPSNSSTSDHTNAQNLWSSNEIASRLPTKNPDAPMMVERMFRFLAANSVLTFTMVRDENGREKALYGLGPVCKYYVRDKEGLSLAPFLFLVQDKVPLDSWYHLKDAIIEGGSAFSKAYGMQPFEYSAIDRRFNEVFNKAMQNNTVPSIRKFVEIYKGLDNIQEMVDVGGNLGQTLATIISKFPHIKGINFDLPHVIKDSPPIAGVKHVGGDMFESIPKGELIFLSRVLHDWGDECCSKLLKNCWKALPKSGKVVVLESIMPDFGDSDFKSSHVTHFDMVMLPINPGAKERTLREYEALAIGAGFAASKLVCSEPDFAIIEFHKMKL